MNFLAHALLAGEEPALVVGGVVGDWIKGPLPGALPADLARGVALHRAIDSFAETHPAFQSSRRRVASERRRYAGVLVDIFYDHLLARSWREHHRLPLAAYAGHTYALIADRLPELPLEAASSLRLMRQEDWLSQYASVEGMTAILLRMARRARQPNPLAEGAADLLADLDGFAADFDAWLADARTFAAAWAATHH